MGKQARARAERRLHGRIDKELRRMGVLQRCEAVHQVTTEPRFQGAFRRTLTEAKPTTHEEVRAVALAILGDLGVDSTDVLLVFGWRRELGQQLTIRAIPTIESVKRAQETLATRSEARA